MGDAVVILSSRARREQCARWVFQAKDGTTLKFTGPKRSLSQNDRLHAMITDVAAQVKWAGAKRNVEAWKDIFTAALRSAKHSLDVVPGINGGFVLLGMHTSSMSVAEMGDLMTLIEAWGAENGVTFTEPTAPGGDDA